MKWEELTEAFREEIAECTESLLRGIPTEGGNVTREDLRRIIETAFIDGVITAGNKAPTNGNN